MKSLYAFLALILGYALLTNGQSIYSIIAPGTIKSNRIYQVAVSLHDAAEPATIKLRLQGPSLHADHNVFLQPHQTIVVAFVVPKLVQANHKLIAEGVSGITFRNETEIYAVSHAGPKIYIQTDKGVYKPGDEVQFRVVMLDEHTRPLKISEPIRVEIQDEKGNRVKQFKDIKLIKGVYKNRFQLSQHPVLGSWTISVSISGNYDYGDSKSFRVMPYVLPKFSVYLKTNSWMIAEDGVLNVLVYGKYTFDKYVEGTVVIKLVENIHDQTVQEKQLELKDMQEVEFRFENPQDLKAYYGFSVKAELTEKHTGITHQEATFVLIRDTRYVLNVDVDQIEYKGLVPYRLKLKVRYWDNSPVLDHSEPVVMTQGSKEYLAYLDGKGEATFEYEYDKTGNHEFRFKDAKYKLPNILLLAEDENKGNATKSYCKVRLLGDRPRLGVPIELEVTSSADIPYLIYAIVGHGNIIEVKQVGLSPGQKSHTITIIPSIDLVPRAYVMVYYVTNGNLHYDEITLKLPEEFENKVAVVGPKHTRPGQQVTLEMKAQPGSYVGLLAVDLGVFLLDSSYDLERYKIMHDLLNDRTNTPFPALLYPGIVSGLVTLTNAHYKFVPLNYDGALSPAASGPLRFRKKFPETWIFENYEITNDVTKLTLTIPDTITTWRITAFSVHEKTGFGIVDGPTDVTTIQPFFIDLSLPYSVKRGEIVSIPVLVHNYHDQDLDTEVTLQNVDGEFYFMEAGGDTQSQSAEQERTKRTLVPSNSVKSVLFVINPSVVGNIKLQLVARNAQATDAIIKELKVEPEGARKRVNKALYLSSKEGENFRATLPVNIPKDIVPNSEYISLAVGCDSLVPTIKNLNNLVLLPTGCGEQNMVNFAPNILVLQFLKASGRYFKERALVNRAKRFIDVGYQQQLSYRHGNGGFSVFGENDKEPSTWLTAYVIRFFIKATKYVYIEDRIIDSGLEYLQQKQLPDGGFPYTGYLFYPAQQNRFGFAAFVLMTFLEDPKYLPKYKAVVDKGFKFLEANMERVKDIYALSIIAAAMRMANHANAPRLEEKLLGQRRELNNTMWWTQSDENREKDVEITAYVLMALLAGDNGSPRDHLRILKWLTEQRNELGGFHSTHDTVVGLQALVRFSERYNQGDNVHLRMSYAARSKQNENLRTGSLEVDGSNLLILQSEELPNPTRSIDISLTGTGHSLLQLTYHYHVHSPNDFQHFQISPKPKLLNDQELLLEICFNYQELSAPSSGSSGASNMVILEANLPSGYTTSDEFSSDLLENENVQRIESRNEDTTIVIYIGKLVPKVKQCLNILASRLHDVEKRKPAAVVMYDYYNISRHDTAFYTI